MKSEDPCGHRVNTLTCFEISENNTPEGSYHRLGVVFGKELVILVDVAQLFRHKIQFTKTNFRLCADKHGKSFPTLGY